MSLKPMLLEAYEKEKEQEAEQKKLKEKHNLDVDDNVIVVEKNNMVKFFIRLAIKLVKLCFTLILIYLAFVGLVALVYPAPRAELKDIFTQTIEQLTNLFQ